jgi:hypothetical protein
LVFAINEGEAEGNKLQHPIQLAQSNALQLQRGVPAKPLAPKRKNDLFAAQFRNYSPISTAKNLSLEWYYFIMYLYNSTFELKHKYAGCHQHSILS